MPTECSNAGRLQPRSQAAQRATIKSYPSDSETTNHSPEATTQVTTYSGLYYANICMFKTYHRTGMCHEPNVRNKRFRHQLRGKNSNHLPRWHVLRRNNLESSATHRCLSAATSSLGSSHQFVWKFQPCTPFCPSPRTHPSSLSTFPPGVPPSPLRCVHMAFSSFCLLTGQRPGLHRFTAQGAAFSQPTPEPHPHRLHEAGRKESSQGPV